MIALCVWFETSIWKSLRFCVFYHRDIITFLQATNFADYSFLRAQKLRDYFRPRHANDIYTRTIDLVSQKIATSQQTYKNGILRYQLLKASSNWFIRKGKVWKK